MYPIIVIGAGAAGLVAAVGAGRAGKKVLLIENGKYGGDCTNFGCIPSKALISSAEAAHIVKTASDYGIEISLKGFDARGALKRTKKLVEEVRQHNDPEWLTKQHVEALTGLASFKEPHTLNVKLPNGETREIKGEKIIIATGTRPLIPPISGLQGTPYLTNETIFDLEEIPESLAVIGGGPIGCELGQAFGRLGSKVTILQKDRHLLSKEEPETATAIEQQFVKEGMKVYFNCYTTEIAYDDKRFTVKTNQGVVTASHLLIAAGRTLNMDWLNLEAAGVKYGAKGITVNEYGQTSQRHIWAVGDITGRALFTHVAENEARSVLKSMLLPWRTKEDRKQAIPRVTFTAPEVAAVGLCEAEAIGKYGESRIAVYSIPFSEIDRALTSGHREGFVKIVTKKWSGKILGATILCERAGEMLPEISLAMLESIPIRKLARLIHPYPIYNQAIRKAADWALSKHALLAGRQEVYCSGEIWYDKAKNRFMMNHDSGTYLPTAKRVQVVVDLANKIFEAEKFDHIFEAHTVDEQDK